MKIFIIGPEGAGKTVFLTMFSRHMSEHPDKLVFAAEDYESTQYVAAAMDLLECRKWPKSNPQGDLKLLRWRFGRKGGKTNGINLFDYSGQDMRSVLLEDNPEKLQGRIRELRDEIDDSDMLIYLLDMDGLIGSGVLKETNENAWLLHTFLMRPGWRNKRRLLVVTKSDLYSGMIAESCGDLKKMIEAHWPKIYSADDFLRQKEEIECFALTNVKVTTTLDENGNPVRQPALPLDSDGFEPLVEAMLSGIKKDGPKRKVKETGKMIKKVSAFALRLMKWGRNNYKVSVIAFLFLGCVVRQLATDKYQFTFVTGTGQGAGMDSEVSVVLEDSAGSITSASFGGGYALWRWEDPFESGGSYVTSRRMKRLQTMRDLRVEINGSGHKSAWFLERIVVENLSTGEVATFECGRWLGKDEANPGDDPLALVLTAS